MRKMLYRDSANVRFWRFRVQTIGKVVGWMGITLGILATVILYIVVGTSEEVFARIKKDRPDSDYAFIQPFLHGTPIVSLTLTVIDTLASVLLLLGTLKNKHLLLLPWLVGYSYGCFSMLYDIIDIDIGRITCAHTGATWIVISDIINLMLQITLWLAIYKLFRTIRDQSSITVNLEAALCAVELIYKTNNKQNFGSERM